MARQIEDDALSAPIHTWSIATVGSFLHRTGLGSFAEVFMARKVNGGRLAKLTDAELEGELGMASSKQRRSILYDVNAWRVKNDPIARAKAAQKAAADQVRCRWSRARHCCWISVEEVRVAPLTLRVSQKGMDSNVWYITELSTWCVIVSDHARSWLRP